MKCKELRAVGQDSMLTLRWGRQGLRTRRTWGSGLGSRESGREVAGSRARP